MEKMLKEHADKHLRKLCEEIGNRVPGSPGNRQATDYFASIVNQYGYDVEQQLFNCIDWHFGGIELKAQGKSFDAHIGPYSLGCNLTAPLAAASTLVELEPIEVNEKILLLHGEIASSQLMPKKFAFYNPDEHKYIYHLLETKAPAAVLSATGRDPDLAGGIYPFPMIEDGDFDIPNAYMTEATGQDLLHHLGEPITLRMEASRHPSTGFNVIARKGDLSRKVLLIAHIDAKINTPGALDNATGTVLLLLLAELFEGYTGKPGIEIIALNGEDYYSAPGQMTYMEAHNWNFDDVILVINSDGAGYKDGPSEYALYECPAGMEKAANHIFAQHANIHPGEPWYQSDHAMFIQQGRPAISYTSSQWMMISSQITHTPDDRPDLVDTSRIVELALATHELVHKLKIVSF